MLLKKQKVIITLLFIAVLCVPSVYSKTSSICIIKNRKVKPYEIALKGCLNVLRKKGCKKKITYYDLEGNSKRNYFIINKIRKKNPDLIISFGTKASKILKKKINDIPVVFTMVLNPIETGLINKIRSSEDNFVGASMNVPPEHQFKLLKEVLPQGKKVGVIYDSKKTGDTITIAIQAAKKCDLELIKENVFSPEEVPIAINRLIKKIDVLWLIADTTVISYQSLQYILKIALKEKIPVIAQANYVVEMGALIGLECDYKDIGIQSGELACKILKGEKLVNLQTTVPRKTILTINSKVAEVLGLKIPFSVSERAHKIFK
ncbi:ABC transporter substrate-binding protein [bacterium]|nr:ABC transporter substrate-binding protein [bacterium]